MSEHTTRTRRSASGEPEARARRRANGEGSIYATAEGRWRGALTWTDDDGRQRRRVVSGKTQDAVRRRLTELRADLDKGREPAASLTVAAYLARWLEAERQRVRPATWRQREQYVRCYILPAVGRMPLAKVAPGDVEKMTAGLVARGLSPRTAATARTILRRALSLALRDGLVHRNAAALAEPPRVPGREVEYLDRTELRRLLASLGDDPLGPLVTLAASSGLRQGELLGLSWPDVDMDGATLTVRQSMARDRSGGYSLAEPKTTRSRRTIHLPDVAVVALRRQSERQDALRAAAGPDWQDTDRLVFTDRIGRPLRGTDVTHAFGGLLERAGIRHVPFHALRHSWATLALATGVPLKVVADNLGHASIAVTAAFYSGIVPQLNRDAADAIGRALGAES